jgi:catalase
MAKSSRASNRSKHSKSSKSSKDGSTIRNSRTTVSGPAEPDASGRGDVTAEKAAATQDVASAFTFNPNKAAEYDPAAALAPPEGASVKPSDPIAGASTVTELNGSDKVGSGGPNIGQNPTVGPLDRVRVDSTDRVLTTNQGVAIADNQSSLKAGLRGPTLLEDFILREKITHFDHERIPERIVHARGSAAHGFFECTKALTNVTRASVFAEVGKQTPVFVRFSTVLGERGSTDTARDVRGFAVKFYTDEGNWDLVGNNIPVFFIQDALKFPDLVHAAKPEPHFAMPQAASAHDTFWDFASLMPEITHMLMWAMSDRAIPRSYRTMQGFGVHTYRFVNASGESTFVKFHWSPKAGTHSLVWDEAVKISGADPDFHRRDLWEAIEAGAYPEYELGLQIFTEEQAEGFTFDVLDATKIVPEELVPIVPVGRLVLNRNPDNFFAETEQVAFCVAHVVPGIDFSNDPLLAGRIHSYVDTQISRLGSNFHEIPINAPIAQVHNNQRDGMHRQAIHRGRVSYEPNSLGGGCPFQAGVKGFVSFPEPPESGDHKVRGKAERFADHYTQATLFWNSQTDVEKQHIINAFRFELSRVQTPAVRERMVSGLLNVARELAEPVAAGLGIRELPPPMPKVLTRDITPEVSVSPALSLFARPGDGSIRTRRVAIVVADGCDVDAVTAIADRLTDEGAVPRFVSTTLGAVQPGTGDEIEIDVSLEAAPAVLYDALVLPNGADAVTALRGDGRTLEFIKDQYRHCKPILALGESGQLLEACGIKTTLPNGDPDTGVLLASDAASVIDDFVAAMAKHRHFARETDPPRV